MLISLAELYNFYCLLKYHVHECACALVRMCVRASVRACVTQRQLDVSVCECPSPQDKELSK